MSDSAFIRLPLQQSAIRAVTWRVSLVMLVSSRLVTCPMKMWGSTCYLLNHWVQQLTALWCWAHSAAPLPGAAISQLMCISLSVFYGPGVKLVKT